VAAQISTTDTKKVGEVESQNQTQGEHHPSFTTTEWSATYGRQQCRRDDDNL